VKRSKMQARHTSLVKALTASGGKALKSGASLLRAVTMKIFYSRDGIFTGRAETRGETIR
jgi:hypothetical protein